MNIIGIITARMGSSRFPGKPMAMINGMPMVGHVYLRSKMCRLLDEVYVATCNSEIEDYIHSIGGKAIMTSDTHERAADRSAEAMLKVEAETGGKVDILLLIQGDEPMLVPEMLEDTVALLKADKKLLLSTLITKVGSREEHEDPNEVKVVIDKDDFALYFSREPIPYRKKGTKDVDILKHIGIIAFRRDFLIQFNNMPQSPLEIAESVDMLRVLENGYKIKTALSRFKTYSVDTQEDLHKVAKEMEKDKLCDVYAER